MEKKAFAVRDAKVESFDQPFFCHTHGEAERSFTEAVNDPKSMLCKYPEDYDLWYLGNYNHNTGLFKALETPQHLVKAVTVRKQ